jgi:catechol 2,3-dioxygenase-like lactoylglutathione lyase family enzyme
MGKINCLHHVGMSVPSLDEARRFYVDLLGFEELGSGEFDSDSDIDRIMALKGAAAKVAFLSFGDFKIEMFEFAAPAQERAEEVRPVNLHGYTHLCLDVTDVRSLHERLNKAGMQFHSDPVDKAGVRTVYGRDPFGNAIELQEIVDFDPTEGSEF